MKYLIHEDKMQELNDIIGNQGSPATSKVSDSFAALEVAIKTGTKAEAQAAFTAAVDANKLVGKAWENAQEWHDNRINEDQYEGDDGGKDPGGDLPAIPSNAIQMFRGGDGHLTTEDGKDITIHGKNYAAYVTGGKGASAPWQWFKADMNGNHVSLSCDGKKIAFVVGDTPTDPGEPYNANTAMHMPYKKGQIASFRIGEGGYSNDTMAIFSVN